MKPKIVGNFEEERDLVYKYEYASEGTKNIHIFLKAISGKVGQEKGKRRQYFG